MLRFVDLSILDFVRATISHSSLSRHADVAVLRTLNRYLPLSFDRSYQSAPTLEDVLTNTEVSLPLWPGLGRLASREYRFRLKTVFGRIPVRMRVLPARRPDAPLVIYQHGFNIIPYDGRGRIIFAPHEKLDAHVVLLQFPFHTRIDEPIRKVFASLHHFYVVLAGSVRMMEMVQNHYEALGAPYTVVAGTSLGGISSVLYEALFQRTRAVVPLYSSPNFAQLLWDAGELLHRPVGIPKSLLLSRLDFTPYYREIDQRKVFPLLGEKDLFFRWEHHANIYESCRVASAGNSHISAMVRLTASRKHMLRVLSGLA